MLCTLILEWEFLMTFIHKEAGLLQERAFPQRVPEVFGNTPGPLEFIDSTWLLFCSSTWIFCSNNKCSWCDEGDFWKLGLVFTLNTQTYFHLYSLPALFEMTFDRDHVQVTTVVSTVWGSSAPCDQLNSPNWTSLHSLAELRHSCDFQTQWVASFHSSAPHNIVVMWCYTKI